MMDLLSLPRAGEYRVVLADPPWAFRTFSGENMTPHRCAEDHYRTMDLAALKTLPVGDVAARDCALFMWIVGSHLLKAIDLARAWGFEFKTDAFYWAKQRLRDADQIDLFTDDIAKPRMGFGYWTRKQVEPCWLFTRGNPGRLTKGVRQLIIEPRREHSRKPDETYARIERLVEGPYLELVARQQWPGWDCWGAEVGKFDAATTTTVTADGAREGV
jgi:N6-adenosine-specific RNA methylase IME4